MDGVRVECGVRKRSPHSTSTNFILAVEVKKDIDPGSCQQTSEISPKGTAISPHFAPWGCQQIQVLITYTAQYL
jgi:hypothetical protein